MPQKTSISAKHGRHPPWSGPPKRGTWRANAGGTEPTRLLGGLWGGRLGLRSANLGDLCGDLLVELGATGAGEERTHGMGGGKLDGVCM